MRFSASALLALPLLAVAQREQSPFENIVDQVQGYFDKFATYIPNPNIAHTFNHAAAATAGKAVHTLSLDNWKSTLTSGASSYSEGTAEWWVLISGANKTCYGMCGKVETAFNESAALFALDPTAPNLAYINCDYQPILCNSWAAGPPSLYVMEVPKATGPTNIRIVGLNTTTTDVTTFTDLHSTQSWKQKPLYDGFFHPFDGAVAQFGLAVPLGYVLWVFAVIPSWAFMIGISFISRTMMSRRTPAPGAGAQPAAAGAPRTRAA